MRMLSLRLTLTRVASLHTAAAVLASERLYTKKHEWIRVKGNEGTVGITDFATEQLGDVVYVELPAVGAAVGAGDSVAAVESVKAASDIYSPVSGVVTAKNEKLETEPALLNKSPLENGWIYKLEVKDPKELATLLNQAQYEKVKSEESD